METVQENYEAEKRKYLEKNLGVYKNREGNNKTIFKVGLGCLVYFSLRYFTGADIDTPPATFLGGVDLIAGFTGFTFTLIGGTAYIIHHANKKSCEKELKKPESKNLENIVE